MKVKLTSLLLLIFLVLGGTPLAAQDDARSVSEANYSGLELRNIGPALTSGRIADIAIHPNDENTWYVAVGSGGVWKTTNAGTSWDTIFDNQSSYSIGSVTIDPNNPNTIWVGSGENVGGRHVGYGDGVYKSTDGGDSWQNMGLKNSEHISKVIVHPKDSDIIWVAAQGPLWDSGGDRGLYKSTDGGDNWNKVLGDDEWVGVTDIVMDPRNPDRLYAATWQRHRTAAAYMGGGPGTGIHKSTDGGDSWKELESGLPSSNMGKIGLAISPQKPDIVYAAITLDRTTGGVFKSEDRGASWKKMSNTVAGGTGPHYYQELYASPHHFGTLYLMDVQTEVSTDHGATFEEMDTDSRHVDDHAIAFREDDPNYILIGTDGGIYESFDQGKSWHFINNMPITQFYKVAVDDAKPFYNVYGGTQDNGSQMGPSRTDNEDGIRNADWQKTLFADGHDTATEPGNPEIFYAETQQGGLHRIDRTTGDQVMIQPQAGKDEKSERFNWDAPIEVSPHSPTKLLFASQRVWISENRGNSWTAISGDLTLDQNRLKLPIMGKQRSWDNPWDMNAMSNYNTITSLAESPRQEGLIYAGTDDGRIQVTENGGDSWREIKLSDIDGVPEKAFINDIKADRFDANTVYVAMDDHKNGDFSPYLIKSTDRGESWSLISNDLPDRHLVWRVIQDHKKQDLLFAGTEFGVFFTVDGGENWQELNGGVPTIPFRDLEIQRDHNDLVGATFGRGFYILDDYSPLREVDNQTLNQEAKLFTPRETFWYIENSVVGSMGDNYFKAENPPFGTVFTYYLKDSYKSMKAQRQEREAELDRDEDVPFPGWDNLEAEMCEEEPKVVVTIKNESGNVVNRIEGPTSEGFHRINWELNYPSKDVVELDESSSIFDDGFMATPGTYTATLSKVVRGEVTQLSEPVTFDVVPLRDGALEGASNEEFAEFRETLENFQQDLTRTTNTLQDQITKVNTLQRALSRADQEAPDLVTKLNNVRLRLQELNERMNGSEAKQEVGQLADSTSPRSRLFVGYRALNTTYGPTQLHRETIETGKEELSEFQKDLSDFTENVMPELEKAVQNAGAPPIEDN
ncbi:glycosyl hydrolase [Aliifodinibius salipaludis]|uniref:Glycosyl hydrolase n=1 Tax=Fodinibius salipaludis TaxID=2032627 RepID=A0A2A2GFQ1_9BACT|nr:glycosyl hydrolase [Aliifodinibius salipaludis]PAU95723.1 glycosyl hydrolase [Aliifodinibius salipaludis]